MPREYAWSKTTRRVTLTCLVSVELRWECYVENAGFFYYEYNRICDAWRFSSWGKKENVNTSVDDGIRVSIAR